MRQQLYYLIFIAALAVLFTACKNEETIDTPQPTPPINSSGSGGVKVFEDMVQGIPIVVAGSREKNLIVSFERTLPGGELLSFTEAPVRLPFIMEDTSGTKWDIFGRGSGGMHDGKRLKKTYSYMGYWFSIGAFYPGSEIFAYQGPTPPITTAKEDSDGWAVSVEDVFWGSGKDAIPALDSPPFLEFREQDFVDQAFYVENNDLVIGVQMEGELRLYPHKILDWHEIINDQLGNTPFALVYCPLTGTADAWDRRINGQETTFGVSGLLYNNNVIPYDRLTDSRWSQMKFSCINGELINSKVDSYQIVETTWSTWKSFLSEIKITSDKTGTDRDYNIYPYGEHKTNNNFIPYPLTHVDDRLPAKERVHAIIVNGEAKVYRFDSF